MHAIAIAIIIAAAGSPPAHLWDPQTGKTRPQAVPHAKVVWTNGPMCASSIDEDHRAEVAAACIMVGYDEGQTKRQFEARMARCQVVADMVCVLPPPPYACSTPAEVSARRAVLSSCRPGVIAAAEEDKGRVASECVARADAICVER